MRYRALSWNPAVKRFARARLQNFDVVHIFGLYDLLGPAIAAQCRILKIPYVIEPIGMFLPIVRSFWKKRVYQSLFGRKMIDGARFLIATSEQEADELGVRRNSARKDLSCGGTACKFPRNCLRAEHFAQSMAFRTDAKVILFLGRLSKKKSPELAARSFRGS